VYEKVCRWMKWRSDLLNTERVDDLIGEYLFPLAIYQDEYHLVVQGPEELRCELRRLRDSQTERGIVRMDAKVRAMDLPRNGRLRIWVSYLTLDAQGRTVTHSEVIHYCRQTAEGLKTEMLDYGNSTLPVVWAVRRQRMAQKA
jgi:hypothetical protein